MTLAFVFLNVHTLYNDCSHIEDVHLLFCAPLINIFLFVTGAKLRLFPSELLRGCLVYVFCKSNSIHSFIF